ncbi:MAG: glycoside hydrolase family 2 protein [Chloroflexi bacterium]|nr:glycoside hydrolase family 2 protein [Chloroflexota bacterium]
MNLLSLNGSWQVSQVGGRDSIPATIPGCIHLDLLAAGRIPDPFYRDNELGLFWIGETDWVYSRRWQLPPEWLGYEHVLLRCKGLDTLASISVNGHPVGQTANMFRTWEFELKELLHESENEIVVRFDAAMPYVRRKAEEVRRLPAWGVGDHKLDGGGWIRKEPCNFGWDWGPKLVTCGIWRDIELVGYDRARLADVHILQDHSESGVVGLMVAVVAEGRTAGLQATVSLSFEGKEVARAILPIEQGRARAELTVRDAQLWWPNGMGAQPLYLVQVNLLDEQGHVLDAESKRIGLRTLELQQEDDPWGRSFRFACNGVPFFAKGANWIPADVFAPRVRREDYRRLLGDAVAANMNMLRVWGGGIYEEDAFYDLCDELGICVWQDFIFACATYPTFDPEWMENVGVEAEQNVRRLRHHPCLALWCGNNELEQGLVGDEWSERTMSWEDYARLFDRMLPEIVNRLDPQTDYWPSSPHSPCGDRRDFNNPACGDAHLWSVWHGRQPFEWYRTCKHRFNSEFGFQSFPEPKTVYTYTEPRDRNITSFVMEHHQRSGVGNTLIMTYMLDWFRLPSSFENTLWLSQILQGMAIKYAVEHWRRGMPRGMGTLYWQLNDCWPVASWSSIDGLGRWKALHYMARKFYAPLLISGVEDGSKGSVEIHVTSDLGEAREGKVVWTLTDIQGESLETGAELVHIAPRADACIRTLDVSQHLKERSPRDLLVWLDLEVDGEIVSTNLITFARPKHLELAEPGIRIQTQPLDKGAFQVTLTAEKPALWAWLELAEGDARYSDNFVHLRPGVPLILTVTPTEELSEQQFRRQLVARSLVNTY